MAADGTVVARLPVRNVGALLNSSLGEGKPGDEDIVKSVFDCGLTEEEIEITSTEAMAEGKCMRQEGKTRLAQDEERREDTLVTSTGLTQD